MRRPRFASCPQPYRSCLQFPTSYRLRASRWLLSRLPWPAARNLRFDPYSSPYPRCGWSGLGTETTAASMFCSRCTELDLFNCLVVGPLPVTNARSSLTTTRPDGNQGAARILSIHRKDADRQDSLSRAPNMTHSEDAINTK